MNETNVVLDDLQTLLVAKTGVVRLASLYQVRRALLCGRSPDPEESDNGGSHGHGSVFQHHNPARNQPRPSNCPQMPDIISRNNA